MLSHSFKNCKTLVHFFEPLYLLSPFLLELTLSFPRLVSPPNRTSLMISHLSLPLLPPISKMSLNNTSSALSRTSRMHYCGGLTTELSTHVSLRWHLTTCQYQVCTSFVRSPILDLITPIATSVDVDATLLHLGPKNAIKLQVQAVPGHVGDCEYPWITSIMHKDLGASNWKY